MGTEQIIIIIAVILTLGVAVLIWLVLRLGKRGNMDPQLLLVLQQRMEALDRDLRGSLTETMKHQQQSSYHMTSTVRDVAERLVKIEETNKQVLNFSAQLENLQRILTNPKQRGILGEYYLETLLKNVIPPGGYEMQYRFSNGEIVDAVVFVNGKVVPIDSKFSLENYHKLVHEQDLAEREKIERLFKQDLKNRIDETSKYIRPEEGTMDFAFMFIPHEAIYYDLLVAQVGTIKVNTRDLIEYAFKEKRVIITSPTSFLAYLTTVLQGLNALKIEEEAKEIATRVQELGKHLAMYEEKHNAVGRHLDTVVNQYNLSSKELKKIDKDVLRITGEGIGVNPLMIDKSNE